mgnify:CR=1 FL=1
MSTKITKVLVEPSKVIVGSTFKLKIKAIRYATYQEIKDKLTYTTIQDYTYGQLKGD